MCIPHGHELRWGNAGGLGGTGQRGDKGRKIGKTNSIINKKYFFKSERNINMWLPLVRPLVGNLAHNPDMCPDWESSQQPFDSQASTQSTETHQPGQ